jgi:phage-related protein
MVKFDVRLLSPAMEFLEKQNRKVRDKIFNGIDRSKENLDPKFFKKLSGDIWEFRTEYQGMQYRLLAFWDKQNRTETLVIATHGFIKKVDKVPGKEIERAAQIQKRYYEKSKEKE